KNVPDQATLWFRKRSFKDVGAPPWGAGSRPAPGTEQRTASVGRKVAGRQETDQPPRGRGSLAREHRTLRPPRRRRPARAARDRLRARRFPAARRRRGAGGGGGGG